MSEVREPLIVNEPVTEGAPQVREALIVNEPVTEGAPQVRLSLLCLETVISVPEEGELATDLFPSELGVSWEAIKSPVFSVDVRQAKSLRTIRNSNTPYPAWDFEVSFPWLPSDNPFMSGTLEADFKVVCRFFQKMGGRHRDFLFRDCEDYRVSGGDQGTGDGLTTEFLFVAEVGGWSQPVGQVDLLERFAFVPADVTAAADTIAHAGHGLATADGPFFVSSTTTLPPGLAASTPYWAIVVDAATIKLAASAADAAAGTAVDITGAGAGTHSLTGGWAVYADDALVAPADVTFVTPNGFTFDVAPLAGVAVTADFGYLFVCHFEIDAAEFRRFAGDLYELQQLRFRADPP